MSSRSFDLNARAEEFEDDRDTEVVGVLLIGGDGAHRLVMHDAHLSRRNCNWLSNVLRSASVTALTIEDGAGHA